MPQMTDRRSVAANSVVENVLSGKLHEFITAQVARVRLFGTGSAVGLNASMLVGGESFTQDQEISGANRFPIDPDDFVVEGAGVNGDRILVSVRNTTGAAITSVVRVEVEPLA